MRITAFGSPYGSAYTFGNVLFSDDWEATRPAVVSQAAGAAGVFDFYSSYGYPPGPMVIRKRFTLCSATSSGIDDARDTLVEDVVASDRSYLWAIDRDQSTTYWTPAKCTRFRAGERAQEDGRWLKEVELEFMCPDGLWYGATDGSVSSTMSVLVGGIEVTNSGNYPAAVNFTVGSGITDPNYITVAIRPSGGGDAQSTWTYGAATTGMGLVVNARTYECTNNSVDDYDNLTLGSGQVAWLWIPTGTWEIDATPASYTGDPAITASWHHTYLL